MLLSNAWVETHYIKPIWAVESPYGKSKLFLNVFKILG
jgi:hypothetical protein